MTAPYYTDPTVTVYAGDCLDVLATLPDASVDAVVTDPPYGLEFMGKEWDSFGGDRRQPFLGEIQTPDNPYGRSTVRYAGSASYGARVEGLHAFQQWCQQWATECLRVLKPGGHLLAFGGTRTSHRLACAIEDAGFEIRDSIAWLYGSGFPKSLDVSKAIDKAAGAEREIVGDHPYAARGGMSSGMHSRATQAALGYRPDGEAYPAELGRGPLTAPATPDAERWQGWGTALKPAHEPVVVARKPLVGTVAGNVLAHGTGALNVDGCRVATDEDRSRPPGRTAEAAVFSSAHNGSTMHLRAEPSESHAAGRWPANVILDESQAAALDQQSGESVTPSKVTRGAGGQHGTYSPIGRQDDVPCYGDIGGASRFFYTAKADAAERVRLPKVGAAAGGTVAGVHNNRCAICGRTDLSGTPCVCPEPQWIPRGGGEVVAHPTVKPLALMRWLVRLVTPPGGTVLEPFAGSGTTVEACILEGFRCIAIEREADYLPLIRQRIHRRRDPVEAVRATGEDAGLFDLLGGDA